MRQSSLTRNCVSTFVVGYSSINIFVCSFCHYDSEIHPMLVIMNEYASDCMSQQVHQDVKYGRRELKCVGHVVFTSF